jgi:hypothetical protein
MSERKNRIPAGMKSIKVTVPEDVAHYYEGRAHNYGTSISAAASPVLCAQARGEIRSDFVKQLGADIARP